MARYFPRRPEEGPLEAAVAAGGSSPARDPVGRALALGPPLAGLALPVLLRVALGPSRAFTSGWVIAWTIGASVALTLGLPSLLLGVSLRRAARGRREEDALARVPVGGVAAREEGTRVIVEGVAAAAASHPPEPGPLTRVPVLWWTLGLVRLTWRSGRRFLDSSATFARHVPIVIRSGEDVVTVVPGAGPGTAPAHGDTLLRHAPHQVARRSWRPGGERIDTLLRQHGLAEGEAGTSASEWSVREGDRVVALGVVRRSEAHPGGICLSSGTVDRLVVSGETRGELVRALDGPRSGLAIFGAVAVALGLAAAAMTFAG